METSRGKRHTGRGPGGSTLELPDVLSVEPWTHELLLATMWDMEYCQLGSPPTL